MTKSPLLPSNSTICSSPQYVREPAKEWPKLAQIVQEFVTNTSKTKNRPYRGLRASNPKSEGTYSTRNRPLLVVSNPHNHPTRPLHPCITGL